MDIQSVMGNYSTVMSLIKVKSITPSRVKWLFSLFDKAPSEETAEIIAEMITTAGEAEDVNSVFDLFKNEKLLTEVAAIVATTSTEDINDDGEVDSLITLNEHYSIRCPHCKGVFAIGDSPEVADRLLELEQNK